MGSVAASFETLVECRVVQTRTFSVRTMDEIYELMRDMKREQFSGKVVVIMSQGGVNAVTAEESKKLTG